MKLCSIILLLLLLTIPAICQKTYLASKYGITDLKKATDLANITNGSDSAEYRLIESSRNGSLGLDVFTSIGESEKSFFEFGFYYASTTLVGNPGFRYQFVYTAESSVYDTTINARFRYGNMKIGFGRNWLSSKGISLFWFSGLDIEYGETIVINDNFNLSIVDGKMNISNLFVQNALLLGPYIRGSFAININRSIGLIITPCAKIALKMEDDFENDRTIISAPKASFEFSAGIFKLL